MKKNNTGNIKVSSIEKIENEEIVETYDFEIEDNHNYFIEDILVHNSEHVPMLCVGGNVDIACEYGSYKAKEIYVKIIGGEKLQAHSFNHSNNSIELKGISKAFKQQKELFIVGFSDGINLELSKDHPLFTRDTRYIPLEELNVGDSVFKKKDSGLAEVKIKSIESIGVKDVYDFTVKDNHNFFANQILVHNCVDEIDVIQNPIALAESRMIPCTYGRYYPLTVYLSTRKYAGGLMEKTLKQTVAAGGEVLRWNIVDVCERIALSQAEKDKPKVKRYITTELPMSNISSEEYDELPQPDKNKYEVFYAYASIADHKFLPVMKNLLVDRPQDNFGDLYKPLTVVHNNFKQLDVEMATAQLLCDKPSSSGLVYPKFDRKENSITIEDALTSLLGDEPEIISIDYLRQLILDLGITTIGGADWGFSDLTSMIVLVMVPNGDVWLVANHIEGKMELHDIVKAATMLNSEWDVSKWFCDQNYPAYLKTLRKAGITCPKFTKVVEDGIAAVQCKIVDAASKRKFFVLDIPENKQVFDAFEVYSWKKDGKGDIIEGKPEHGSDGTSDILDSIRYPFQCLFTKGGRIMTAITGEEKKKITLPKNGSLKELARSANNQLMDNQIKSLAPKGDAGLKKSEKKNKKRIFWA